MSEINLPVLQKLLSLNSVPWSDIITDTHWTKRNTIIVYQGHATSDDIIKGNAILADHTPSDMLPEEDQIDELTLVAPAWAHDPIRFSLLGFDNSGTLDMARLWYSVDTRWHAESVDHLHLECSAEFKADAVYRIRDILAEYSEKKLSRGDTLHMLIKRGEI